jgi:hypothetical protein
MPVAPAAGPASKPAPVRARAAPAGEQRAAAPSRAAAPKPPVTPVRPGAPLLERGSGPRWAANAIVAAEVFGPPVGARPGGTLGPPNAL